jgi:hypothetical protein
MGKEAKVGRGLYWAPRILSILFICFIALFSLDVFTPGLTISEMIFALLMHNIPTLVLAVILLVSWKFEIVGAVCFILAGMAYMVFVFTSEIPWYIGFNWSLTIAGPAFLVGILFLLNWIQKQKHQNHPDQNSEPKK